MNMIQRLTPSYFDGYFRGALFQKDGRVLKVASITDDGEDVVCYDMAANGRSTVNVDGNFFTGFKVFEYPVLGYRRLAPHVVAYLSRQQSTHRGIRTSTVIADLTPVSRYLNDNMMTARVSDSQKALAIFNQTFDSLRDLPRLLSGELSALVLSNQILIEPDMRGHDGYRVYLRQAPVGIMDAKGRVTWNNKSHSNLFEGL